MKREIRSFDTVVLPKIRHFQAMYDDYLLPDNPHCFDCRRIPADFLADTGAAFLEEYKACKKVFSIPFSECYFEFSDGNLAIAISVSNVLGAETVDTVEVFDARNHLEPLTGYSDDCCSPPPYGSIANGVDFETGEQTWTDSFYGPVNTNSEIEEQHIERVTLCVVGAVALLNQSLIASEFVPDVNKRLNKKRTALSKNRISREFRELTLNIAAIRRKTKFSNIGSATHSSPALHWRRGHSRLLHRGSEFEKETWVSPCLVGDPDKGFLRTAYRLVDHQRMIGDAPKAKAA